MAFRIDKVMGFLLLGITIIIIIAAIFIICLKRIREVLDTEPEIHDGNKKMILKNLSQKEIREHISYVPQKAWLFSGTIADNLKYGIESDIIIYIVI